jgi:VIT1/CCC1 family predicted Fe2+/Mn2+ transporter
VTREMTRSVRVPARRKRTKVSKIAAAASGGGRRVARAVRSTVQRGAAAAGRTLSRNGVNTGHTGRWLSAHRSWTTGIAIALGALALVLWNHPTVGAVALVLLLVLAVLAIMTVLAAAAPASAADPGSDPGSDPGRASAGTR